MKRIKPFVLEGGKTIAVNRKDRKTPSWAGLQNTLRTSLVFIYYGSQKHGRNCMSHQLPLYFHQKPMTLRNYTNKQISFYIYLHLSLYTDYKLIVFNNRRNIHIYSHSYQPCNCFFFLNNFHFLSVRGTAERVVSFATVIWCLHTTCSLSNGEQRVLCDGTQLWLLRRQQ